MIYVLLFIATLVALGVVYGVVLRPWLKKQGWAQGFFAAIEPVEITLYKKSETILIGRLLWVSSGLVTAYDALAIWAQSLDITPLTTRVFDYFSVPADLRSLAGTAAIGALALLMNWLRYRTTKPVPLVAAPENSLPAATQVAIAKADAAKDKAVAAVQSATS